MKIQYNREDDALLIHFSDEIIEHAEQVENLVLHFSPDNHLVLLECLDASDFLARLTKTAVQAASGEKLPV